MQLGAARPDHRLAEIEHEVMSMKAHIAMQQQDVRMMQPNSMATSQTSFMLQAPSKEHRESMEHHQKLMTMYNDLMKTHMDLTEHCQRQAAAIAAMPPPPAKTKGKAVRENAGMSAACSLGVVRLDYDYPPAPGDIDCPQSFGYDVYYRVVPGLTFSMCQSGKMTPEVEREFEEAINYLIAKGVSGITGDCGFMMYFQHLARHKTTKPVFMSALAQLPAVTCAFNSHELIAILTANGKSLAPMRGLIKDECGVDTEERRYVIVGCEHVPGFEAVAEGGKVNVEKVTPGIVQLLKETLHVYPKIRAVLLECTELPPYADAIRAATGLPVFDAITCCDFFISGGQDNARFGIQNWQKSWDGKQADYKFGANLDAEDRAKLVNKMSS